MNNFIFNISIPIDQGQNLKEQTLTGETGSDMDLGQHVSEISSKATKTLGFFAGIWLLHLGVQRKLHTKLWFGLN